MGLFRSIGRRVQRFSEQAKQAKEENATYQCTDCETGFYTHDDRCPECGSSAVVRRETESIE
jgi:rRNA maturation endonuclease Nob1